LEVQLISAAFTENVRNRPLAVSEIGFTVWNSMLFGGGLVSGSAPLVKALTAWLSAGSGVPFTTPSPYAR
jgi:hypothetical protein